MSAIESATILPSPPDTGEKVAGAPRRSDEGALAADLAAALGCRRAARGNADPLDALAARLRRRLARRALIAAAGRWALRLYVAATALGLAALIAAGDPLAALAARCLP